MSGGDGLRLEGAGASRPWSAGEAVAHGWRMVWREPMGLLVLFVGLVLQSLIPLPGDALEIAGALADDDEMYVAGFVLSLALSFVNLPVVGFVQLGLYRYSVRIVRGEQAGFSTLFSGGRFMSYAAAYLLGGFAILVGLVACVVPGVFLMVAWCLTGRLIMERRLGPLEALAESFRLTQGHRLELFLLGLLLFAIQILGLLACCVGLVFTLLIGLHAMTWAFLRILGEDVPASAPPPAGLAPAGPGG